MIPTIDTRHRLRLAREAAKLTTQQVADLLDVATIRDARGWVFPSTRGTTHITPIWASTIVSEFLPDPWTAHTLRHSFATHAYDASRDLLALAQVLGHESPETTRRYVAVPMDALRAVAASAA